MTKSKLEMARTSRELEDLKKKMVVLEKAKDELTSDRTKLKTEVVEMKRTLAEHKHAALVERKKMDSIKQEITSLEHNLRVRIKVKFFTCCKNVKCQIILFLADLSRYFDDLSNT